MGTSCKPKIYKYKHNKQKKTNHRLFCAHRSENRSKIPIPVVAAQVWCEFIIKTFFFLKTHFIKTPMSICLVNGI